MRLFVGCSSRNDIPREYFDSCRILLEELMKENDLVFGAFNGGLMGLSYETALKNERMVTGICPEAYKHDLKDLKCNVEVLTKTVNDRTDGLINYSDALMFLPGGIGTIYELFMAIESKRCHEFDKPIILYNCCGFFDKLINFMDKLYDENFCSLKDKNNYVIFNSVNEVMEYLNNYENMNGNNLKKVR